RIDPGRALLAGRAGLGGRFRATVLVTAVLPLGLAEIGTPAFALRLGWALVAAAVEFRLASGTLRPIALATTLEWRPAALSMRAVACLRTGLRLATAVTLALV